MGSVRSATQLLRHNVKLHGGRALAYAYGLGESRYLEYASALEELGTLGQEDWILDVGSGHSLLPTLINSKVVVLDKNREALQDQLHYARKTGTELAAVHADALHLPFKPESFSGVVSISAIEHIPEDTEAWRELMRVLKGGGMATVTLPGHVGGERTREDPFEGVPLVYRKLFPGFLRNVFRKLRVDRGESYYEFIYTTEDVKERVSHTPQCAAYEVWGVRSRWGELARLMIAGLHRTLLPLSTVTVLEYLFAKNLRMHVLDPGERSGLLIVKMRRKKTHS